MFRVFVVDDEEIIRTGIRNTLEKTEGRFLFTGEAPDGEMALPVLLELKPDILVTDVRMPFMDGLELAALVRKSMPWVRIIFLSGHDEFEYAQRANIADTADHKQKLSSSLRILSGKQKTQPIIKKTASQHNPKEADIKIGVKPQGHPNQISLCYF